MECLITPFGDEILYGCFGRLCKTCSYDPFPKICSNMIKRYGGKRHIYEIRNGRKYK